MATSRPTRSCPNRSVSSACIHMIRHQACDLSGNGLGRGSTRYLSRQFSPSLKYRQNLRLTSDHTYTILQREFSNPQGPPEISYGLMPLQLKQKGSISCLSLDGIQNLLSLYPFCDSCTNILTCHITKSYLILQRRNVVACGLG